MTINKWTELDGSRARYLSENPSEGSLRMKAWAVVLGVLLGTLVIAIGTGGLFALVAALVSLYAGSTIDRAADVGLHAFRYGWDIVYFATAFGAGYLWGLKREEHA